MDTITHGIAGALIGKALFRGEDVISRRPMNRARLVTWALMLGAVFPDSDMIGDMLSRNDLLLLTWHRSITHSLICLPIFAMALAGLTLWFARWRSWESPSLVALAGIYAVGISSHIFLDLVTTFGTMIWSPVQWSRPAWDLLFIVDFSFTGILLIPQLLEWVNRDPAHAKRRALMVWVIFVPSPFLIAAIARIVRAPISDGATVMASLLFSLLLLLPAFRGWGARVKSVSWNRAGFAAACFYLGLAAYAHHAALRRVRDFVGLEKIDAQVIGALPFPPSLWNWDGLVRTSRGVYEMRIDLSKRSALTADAATPEANSPAIEYHYYPDAPENPWIKQAFEMSEVKTVMWFARFPVTRFHKEGSDAIVEISDLRFPKIRKDRPAGFTYHVRFGPEGKVVSQGWLVQ